MEKLGREKTIPLRDWTQTLAQKEREAVLLTEEGLGKEEYTLIT